MTKYFFKYLYANLTDRLPISLCSAMEFRCLTQLTGWKPGLYGRLHCTFRDGVKILCHLYFTSFFCSCQFPIHCALSWSSGVWPSLLVEYLDSIVDYIVHSGMESTYYVICILLFCGCQFPFHCALSWSSGVWPSLLVESLDSMVDYIVHSGMESR